jgi:ribonuclease T1
MSNITSRIGKTLLALVIALIGTVGAATVATAAPAPPAVVAAAQPACGDTSSYQVDPLSGLPAQATDTVDLIEQGGPYPYPEDGEVFQNREALLPDCAEGYYHEYTVDTPGSSDRGTRRIITGSDGEYFYTDDHYESFDLVDVDS